MEGLKKPKESGPQEPQGVISMPTCGAEETEPPASTASYGLVQEQLNGNHEELR